MRQQAPRGSFHQVEDLLETVGPAVVRIGHLGGVRVRRELHEEAQPLVRGIRRAPLQHPQVLLVHRENQIEAGEVVRLDHACPQTVQVVAAARRRCARARIGRLADVIGRRTGGINFDRQLGRLTRRNDTKHAFSGR
jgi:hypothetical protein